MAENFFDLIMRTLRTSDYGDGDYWGIGANLNNELNLSSLTEQEEALIRSEQADHEQNLIDSVGGRYEGDIPEYGMLRIQLDKGRIILFTFINIKGIQSRETFVKYLTSAQLDRLTRDNISLWFDVNGHYLV